MTKFAGDVQTKIDQIKTVFSREIETVRLHAGDDYVVVEINGDWMFRFPRNAPAQQVLRLEKQFLPRFAQVSPLPVPQLEYVMEGFVGYRKIKGTLLTGRLFQALSRETQRTVTRQMGEFLSAIHTFPLQEAREIGLTEGWDGWRRKAYERFKIDVAPLLSHETRKNALKFFDQFFALRWKPVVIHGDFYPADHVFFDEARQALCGVIDFGDLTIEDAATDMKDVFEILGKDVLRETLAHYSGVMDEGLLDRIEMRIKARSLFRAPYVLEYGFESKLERCLQEIESTFGSGVA